MPGCVNAGTHTAKSSRAQTERRFYLRQLKESKMDFFFTISLIYGGTPDGGDTLYCFICSVPLRYR